MQSIKNTLVFGLIPVVLAANLLVPATAVAANFFQNLENFHDAGTCMLFHVSCNTTSSSGGNSTITYNYNYTYGTGSTGGSSFAASGNRAPVWQYMSDKTVYAGQYLEFTVVANDPENNYLFYDLINPPTGAWFSQPFHTFYWTPSESQAGNYSLQFSVSDGNSIVYTNVNVRVLSSQPAQPTPAPAPTPVYTPTNYPPQFYGFAPTATAIAGQLYTYDVNATDANGDSLTYSLISAPSGMSINTATGFIAWVPTAAQVGLNAARVVVSDGQAQTTADFNVTVYAANVAAPTPAPAPVSNPAPAAPTEAKLVISDIKIENQNGDIVVSWKTNLPAGSRVIYDTASQADKTRNFTYKNATADNRDLVTDRSVNLGKLDTNTVYYLRAVSKTAKQTVVSQEIGFIQLEGGEVRSLFGASLLDIFGKLFGNRGFLWLLILGFAATAFIFYRKHKKAAVKI